MNWNRVLDCFAAENHCQVGMCHSHPLDPSPLLAKGFVPFVREDIQKRTDPQTVLPGAQSVIVVGVPVKRSAVPSASEHGVELSSIGTTEDYHPRVKSVLRQLAHTLATHQVIRYKALVDSPTLDERAFAVRAGLGYIGRHGLIISPLYGTRFNIGLLVTDIAPPEARPVTLDSCPPTCNQCIQACPTHALGAGEPINVAYCLSYLTQKANLTPEEETLLQANPQLYGCDICQNACPKNKPWEKTYIPPDAWAHKTDQVFASEYGHTAMLWQGAERLRRNAALQTFSKNKRI